jgi:hypothetical protein
MIGDHRDFRKEAGLLEEIRDQLAEIYVQATGKKLEDIQQWMDEETWFTGAKAKEAGFITETITAGGTSARFDLSMYDNAPQPNQPTKTDLERVLTRDAGLSHTQARNLLQNGFESLSTRNAGDEEALEAVNQLTTKLKDN